MNSKGTVLLCVLLGVSLVAIAVLSNRIRAQDTLLQDLRRQRETVQQLNRENEALRNIVVDTAEIDRLRADTPLLLKLRNQYGMLSRDLSEPTPPASAHATEVNQLIEQREELLNEERQIQNLSDRAVCIRNLEQIAAAKAKWMTANDAENGFPVRMEDLIPYLPDHKIPVCPDAGHYSVNRTGAAPACSIPGHAVP